MRKAVRAEMYAKHGPCPECDERAVRTTGFFRTSLLCDACGYEPHTDEIEIDASKTTADFDHDELYRPGPSRNAQDRLDEYRGPRSDEREDDHRIAIGYDEESPDSTPVTSHPSPERRRHHMHKSKTNLSNGFFTMGLIGCVVGGVLTLTLVFAAIGIPIFIVGLLLVAISMFLDPGPEEQR